MICLLHGRHDVITLPFRGFGPETKGFAYLFQRRVKARNMSFSSLPTAVDLAYRNKCPVDSIHCCSERSVASFTTWWKEIHSASIPFINFLHVFPNTEHSLDKIYLQNPISISRESNCTYISCRAVPINDTISRAVRTVYYLIRFTTFYYLVLV